MSFDFNAYEHTVIKHEELMARAAIERQLQAARAERPGPFARLRVALGQLLISAGESVSGPARATGHV
ncbi:MAG TPA: hypothetical protein PKD53_20050 [Chloroflexaceae bacterium]|nr:hypothetical protein [Chloroflexaceae bacterium]